MERITGDFGRGEREMGRDIWSVFMPKSVAEDDEPVKEKERIKKNYIR